MRRIIATTIVAAALVAIPAAAAEAGRPGGGGGGGGGKKPSGGTGTITLVLVNSPDTVPNYGETVTFNVSTTATDRPAVELNCFQNGTQVYAAGAGFYPEWPWSRDFVLSSQSWTSGAADCTARLYSSSADGTRTYTLATMAIRVEA
jgi:hypothetical protein